MNLDELRYPRPLGRGNTDLWLLKYNVEDDRFLRIFSDIAQLILASENACADAVQHDDTRYQDFVSEVESDYLEELVGAAFIILQTKIRRVATSALEFHKVMSSEYGIEIPKLSNFFLILDLCGRYRRKHASLTQLVWDIGNYYKHRDEWPVEVWRPKSVDPKSNAFKQQRRTRKSVERVGILYPSTGNMRTAFEFFGIEPYSTCETLAKEIQAWADTVYAVAKDGLDAAIEKKKRSTTAKSEDAPLETPLVATSKRPARRNQRPLLEAAEAEQETYM